MAAAMAAPSPPPQGGLGGQRHSHIVTRRSPDTVLHRREMARQMSAGSPPGPTTQEAGATARSSARTGMAAAMSAPSPGGEYVGWQPALTWRPSAHALFDGASSAAGGEWEESEHPADLRKYNGGHGHTGSSTNFSAITKQTWIVAVMKRFSLESSTNHSGAALQPVDVVRSAVECASPSIPEEQRAAWVARVKKWVATPDARNQIRGAAATEYREDMSRRGMRHVGDPAAALFPEMEKALMEKWDAAVEKGSKLTQMWICSNARHLARRLYPAPHAKAERAGKFNGFPADAAAVVSHLSAARRASGCR